MVMAYTVDEQGVIGHCRWATGTFTNAGGETGGEVVTGLRRVMFAKLQHTGNAVVASAPSINEAFPDAPGSLTIVTVDGADGLWFAIGK